MLSEKSIIHWEESFHSCLVDLKLQDWKVKNNSDDNGGASLGVWSLGLHQQCLTWTLCHLSWENSNLSMGGNLCFQGMAISPPQLSVTLLIALGIDNRAGSNRAFQGICNFTMWSAVTSVGSSAVHWPLDLLVEWEERIGISCSWALLPGYWA